MKHVISAEPLYKTFWNIKMRCTNSSFPGYKTYGGRGITLCKEWEVYATFKRWALDNGYMRGLTIDRIDNNRGYCPENCRWSTHSEQQRNKRNNHSVTLWGKTMIITDWATECGISRQTVHSRLARGWDIEKALTAPAKSEHKSKFTAEEIMLREKGGKTHE